MVSLVERDGKTRSFHVANVTAKNLRPIIVKHASRKSYMMTDESAIYPTIGREFAGHGSVNHSAEEYVKTGGFHHTNTVESHFALLKRGVYGTFHNISELTEFSPLEGEGKRQRLIASWWLILE